MGEARNVFQILAEKSESPRRRYEDSIRMDLNEIGWDGVDWIFLPQTRDQ
jgi:hypothetical protein